VALITGASSGIGRATALLFAREGANVALLSRSEPGLREVAGAIEKAGGRALVLPADVTDKDACANAVAQAVETFSHLDVLVNAAGVIGTGTIETTSAAAWQEMHRVNLDAVFGMMQLCLPHLEQAKGNIVNVSSVAGTRAFPGILAYCVSKAGVDQLTRCAALELAPKGVRVNAVNPGVVVTQLHRRGGMDDEAYAQFLEHSKSTHPLGRVGEADEIAHAILYLASDVAGWVTGVTLNIDGGRHLTCAR
ncbi:MAG: glucose 1-dehydrogenase, partial [Calditrichaeota bacterium]